MRSDVDFFAWLEAMRDLSHHQASVEWPLVVRHDSAIDALGPEDGSEGGEG